MKVSIFDFNGVKVTQIGPDTVCIKTGRKWIYLTYEELAMVGEAVEEHCYKQAWKEAEEDGHV